jgi:hypothetical protein
MRIERNRYELLRGFDPSSRVFCPTVLERVKNRAFGPLVAVTMGSKVLERAFHRPQLADLALELFDMRERECLDAAARASAVAPQLEQLRDNRTASAKG